MCGINGVYSAQLTEEKRAAVVNGMNRCLSHRGPDHDAVWSSGAISLGHRRLSIIDLSEESNQPFLSSDQRFAIVYNGELYNYRELKLELQRAAKGSAHLPYFFRTGSDTEVVLAAYLRWGAACLQHFNGMFAFAICDKLTGKIFIARDRLGVKPLYYYYGKEAFVFSSELRPIINSGLKSFELNREALAEYLMYQTVQAPATIVKGIKMLEAGHYLELDNGSLGAVKYYEINRIGDHPAQSYPDICKKVHELLAHSVQQRLVSDVPFGAFLSGGIDSSAVVALMSQISAGKIRTFNVTFDESEFSESVYARQIARKYNTEHHEIRLKPGDFLGQLPEALAAMDHPGGDGPNTFIVSSATKKAGITMALSGIGGDELFAGYDVFRRMHELNRKPWLNAVPRILRRAGGELLRARKKNVGADKIAELLSLPEISFRAAYPRTRSLFTQKELQQLVPEANPFKGIERVLAQIPQKEDHLFSAVTLAEIQTYLQNVLLRDTDQMSMAVALEVREPFLDYRLLEFVLSLNDESKYPSTPKRLLTDSLGDLIPPEIVHRPKMGFTLPWQLWLKNELKSFCASNLLEFEQRGLCVPGSVTALWTRFLGGDPRMNWSRVWHIVVLNSWIRENKISA